MNHSASLEQRYRRLLRAYPRAYREQHGEELISTLMEAADPQARRPAFREMFSLLVGGFAVRVRNARPGGVPWWADGLHLGVVAVVTTTFATRIPVVLHFIHPVWAALAIVLMLAIIRGWTRVALLLALVAAMQVSRPMILGSAGADWIPFFGPAYGDISPVVPYWLVVVGLAVLAVRPGTTMRARSEKDTGVRWWGPTLPARSFLWLLVPVFCWSLRLMEFSFRDLSNWVLFRAILEIPILALVLCATVAARDSRWALAAAVYLVPGLVYLGENLADQSRRGFAYWGVLIVLVAASLVAARRTRARA
ncbi:hypothetical protein [Streptosporangium sp. 'caverna']|uniref:hypothetical protein n=1 Tax=Streptosporangium sp. 'caverna' TaxID=2202249 RepID=UPI000D7E4C47|nr:hypothetical protein [Streptosporangium sp. 'caverna']AWS43631.1 hypothetical protein DKM19_21930 [Streptosporangium sp. 'caverna']